MNAILALEQLSSRFLGVDLQSRESAEAAIRELAELVAVIDASA